MRWLAVLLLMSVSCRTTPEAIPSGGYRGIEQVTILTKGME